jgi:hypothetical protein
MKWRRYADNSAYESRYAGFDKSLPTAEMPFNTDSKYPTRRAYVVKVRADANPDALAGRLENLVTGRQCEFASGRELLESIASDLAVTLHERPSDAECK